MDLCATVGPRMTTIFVAPLEWKKNLPPMGLGEAVEPSSSTPATLIGGRGRGHLKKNTRDRDRVRVVGGGPGLHRGTTD